MYAFLNKVGIDEYLCAEVEEQTCLVFSKFEPHRREAEALHINMAPLQVPRESLTPIPNRKMVEANANRKESTYIARSTDAKLAQSFDPRQSEDVRQRATGVLHHELMVAQQRAVLHVSGQFKWAWCSLGAHSSRRQAGSEREWLL